VRKIDIKKIFGASVKTWRSQLGFSQEELAERSDLHRTYISDVERGARNLSLESICKLAHALDISISDLFPPDFKIERLFAPKGSGRERKLMDVLLVEDNADDADLALHAFKQARFANEIHVVRDGVEALDYLFCRGAYVGRPATEDPQLILLDLNLPKMSGLEVLRRIKSEKRTRSIPVIVLTVSQKDSDVAECEQLGVKTYIVKPLDFQRLSRVTPQLSLDWGLLIPSAKSEDTIG
jgi:CheY-like chemotaxis protein/DNA-binding XRE family transcriptional regulator